MIALLVYLAETTEYYKGFFLITAVAFVIIAISAMMNEGINRPNKAPLFLGVAILAGLIGTGIPDKDSFYKIIAAMDRERGTITIHGEIK